MRPARIPGEAMILSIYRLLNDWQLTNTVIGLPMVYVATVLPSTIGPCAASWSASRSSSRRLRWSVPVWLRSFRQVKHGTDWGAIMAGSTLMTIPVIVFFLFVQAGMTSGLVSGAVKG